jgi:glycosyltransferase involved in cell wall biosynthesis
LKLGVLARNLFIDWFGGSTRTNRRLLIEVAKVGRGFSIELVPIVDEVYWMMRRGKVGVDMVDRWVNFYMEHGLMVNERLLKHYIEGELHRYVTSIYKYELNEYDILYDPILMPTADPRVIAQIQQIINPVHIDLLYLKQTRGRLIALLIGISDIPLKYKWLLKFAINYGFLNPREVAGLSLFIARSKSLINSLTLHYGRVLFLIPSPGIFKNASIVGKFKSILFYPFYAVDERVLTVSTNRKEDYLVFFSRGDVTKGVFEIPRILKHMRKCGCEYRLKIVSGFANERIKRVFLSLADLYGVKNLVELPSTIGYVPEANKVNMFHEVSKALLTLNPSHADVIPNVVIESLFLKTPVVMYDIPGPYEAFKGAKAIAFVPEFNTKKMALTICNLVRGYDVDTLFEDWKTREIITLHRNWNSIANRFVNLVADFYENKL